MDPKSVAGNPRLWVTSVTVEYDARGKRVRRTFPDPYSARRFYAAKLKAGKNPRVVGASTR